MPTTGEGSLSERTKVGLNLSYELRILEGNKFRFLRQNLVPASAPVPEMRMYLHWKMVPIPRRYHCDTVTVWNLIKRSNYPGNQQQNVRNKSFAGPIDRR